MEVSITSCYAIRSDVYFIQQDNGTTINNDSGAFNVSGASAAALVEYVFTHLDGLKPLIDILSPLPPDVRSAVLSILGKMRKARMLIAFDSASPYETCDRHILMYLGQFCDVPLNALKRFRAARICLFGGGVLLEQTRTALTQYGYAGHDLVANPTDDDDAYDVILLVGDLQPRLINRVLRTHPKECHIAIAAAVSGQHVLVSPAFRPNVDLCAFCASERFQQARPTSNSCDPTVFSAAMASNILIHRIFRAVTSPPTFYPIGSFVNADTLLVEETKFISYEFCDSCGSQSPWAHVTTEAITGRARVDFPSANDQPDVMMQYDLAQTVGRRLFDIHAGPITFLDEASSQVPLSSTEIHFEFGRPRAKTALVYVGPSARETRTQAILGAVERIARETFSQRRTTMSEGNCDFLFGSGWTSAEAYFRALCALALASESTVSEWTRTSLEELCTVDRFTGFLRSLVPACALATTEVEQTRFGALHLIRARHSLAGITTGVGITLQQATKNIILRLIARHLKSDCFAHKSDVLPVHTHVDYSLLGHCKRESVYSASQLLPWLPKQITLLALKRNS